MNKKIVGIVAIGVILAAVSAMAVPVSATQDLRITNHNLNTLNSFTYSGVWYNVGPNSYLLKWYYGGGECFEDAYHWQAPAVYYGKITATIMCDYGGNHWGQCVSMVKNLAHSIVVTDNWQRGRRVMDGGISPGTTIATFPSWNGYEYSGHAAIFREYTYDSSGKINGMIVWDQNWRYRNEKREGLVGMHKISKRGYGGVSDASSYYAIRV